MKKTILFYIEDKNKYKNCPFIMRNKLKCRERMRLDLMIVLGKLKRLRKFIMIMVGKRRKLIEIKKMLV